MARDVKINIGATNSASKVLTKVQGQMQRLSVAAKSAGAKIAGSLKGMTGGLGKALLSTKAMVAGAIAAAVAFKGFQAAIRLAGNAIDAFNVQAEAVRGLSLALKLAGDAGANASQDLQKFAAGLQATVNVGDEVTLGLMKKASMLGVSSDALKDTTKAAIGLSNATGMGLDQALRATIEAGNGSFSMLTRYIPALKAAKDDAERLAIVQGVMGKGLADSADRTGS